MMNQTSYCNVDEEFFTDGITNGGLYSVQLFVIVIYIYYFSILNVLYLFSQMVSAQGWHAGFQLLGIRLPGGDDRAYLLQISERLRVVTGLAR